MSCYCVWCGGTESHIETICPLRIGTGWTWGVFPKSPIEALRLSRKGYLLGIVLTIEYHSDMLKPLDIAIITTLSLEEAYSEGLEADRVLEHYYYLKKELFSKELKPINYEEFKDYRDIHIFPRKEQGVLELSLKRFYEAGKVEDRMCFDEVPMPKNFPKNITWLPVWRM